MDTNLIFLHGGPGLPEYLERFFTGRFGASITTTFYEQARGPAVGVDDLIRQLGGHVTSAGGRTVLVGHSWGGALAIEYLRRTPVSPVTGLVLIDSFLCVADVTVEFERELAERGLHEPSLEQVFFTPEEAAAVGNFARELESKMDQATLARISGEFLPTYDAREWVKASRLPILNIFGARDIRTPARVLRTYADLNSGLETVEVPGAGHFPFVTAAGNRIVVRAITDFVTN